MRRGLVSDVLVTETAQARFVGLLADAPVHVITDKAAKALSETVTPVGLFAVCTLPEVRLADVLGAAPRLVLVAVETSEPGNAGTLIRIADALGADAVVLAGDSVDPYNGKCLRASAGSIFALPVLVEPDVHALVATLRQAGLSSPGHHPRRRAVARRRRPVRARRPGCSGSEAHGLSTELAALADARVRIPMRGERREPQHRCGRGDLPVPERASPARELVSYPPGGRE